MKPTRLLLGNRQRVLILLACGAALTSAAPALGAGSLDVVAQNSITISGFTDTPDSFVASVTLHADGGDVQFTFLPSDLTGADSNSLDRSHVTLLGTTNITSGAYVIDSVNVTGISDPGTYTGKVTLASGGQSLEIPLTVIAKERPALTVSAGSQLKLDVTRCGSGLSCWLAGWLIPDGGQDGSTNILVENAGKGDDTVTAAQVFATGSIGGHTLSGPLDWTGVVAAGSTKALPLTVKRLELPPDHYVGNAFVTVKDGSGFFTIPVDVSVRSGPLWAILALLLGIIVGRLAVHMQSKGNQQTSLLWQLYAVRAQVEHRLSDPEDRACLADSLNTIAAEIYAFQLDVAAAALQQIATAIETLARAEEVELQLQASANPPAQAAALIQEIRTATRAGKYDDAKAALATLQTLIAAAPPATLIPTPLVGVPVLAKLHSDGLSRNLFVLDGALDKLGAGARGQAHKQLNAVQKWLAGGGHFARRVLYWLSGIGPQAAADARLWVIRPLLAVVLILLLVGLGLKTLYAGNASFGSNGFTDYFGLVLWGLSADVAARTLTSLGGTTSAAPNIPAA
jgi:hypothetical protein